MSTSPHEQHSMHVPNGLAWASEIQALADGVIELIENFEPALREGRVPPAFTRQLGELRLTAERLNAAPMS